MPLSAIDNLELRHKNLQQNYDYRHDQAKALDEVFKKIEPIGPTSSKDVV